MASHLLQVVQIKPTRIYHSDSYARWSPLAALAPLGNQRLQARWEGHAEVIYLMMGVDVAFCVLQCLRDALCVQHLVVGELNGVVAQVLPNPSDRRLVEQDVWDVGRLPLGVVACPRGESVLRAGSTVFGRDGACRRMVKARAPISEYDIRHRVAVLEAVTEDARQSLYHLGHPCTALAPVFAHHLHVDLALDQHQEPPEALVAIAALLAHLG